MSGPGESSIAKSGAQPSERIPPLTNVAPSIFVPLQDDILSTELPRDRVERLKAILRSLDYQKDGVKENLLYMFEREKQRIMQEAAEKEQAAPTKIRAGLPPSEVDEFIANMEASPEPGVDYDLQEYPMDGGPDIPPGLSPRDRAVRALLVVVEKGVAELQGLETYMAGIKQQYLERLEKELARIDDAGKRPQERAGTKGV